MSSKGDGYSFNGKTRDLNAVTPKLLVKSGRKIVNALVLPTSEKLL